jgi:hypothetical protein
VQEFVHDRDVAYIGSGACHVVHEAGKLIHADVRFHAEVPLIALPGLVHLRITSLVGILSRAGRVNERGIHDRARTQAQALMLQMCTDCLQYLGAQSMDLQQPTEIEDRGLLWNALKTVDASEPAHHRRVIQRFLHRRVAQRVPLLQEVDAQHGCRRIRLTSPAACNRIVWLDQCLQSLPRHHLIHLVEEQLAARLLALAQALGITECQLYGGSFNVL